MGVRRSYKAGFDPTRLSKVSAWLRHTQTTGGLSQWTSMLDSNHAVQATEARQPAAGTSSGNSRPIATWASASNTAMRWPLNAANNQTTKTGYAGWVRQPTSAAEGLVQIFIGTNGASARKSRFNFDTSRRMLLDSYISGSDGRRGMTPVNTLPAAGTWVWVRSAYNSAGANEAAQARIYVNKVMVTLTFSNLGAGGTLTALPSVTGDIILGNQNDGVSVSGYNGQIGPNFYCLSDDLTDEEETNLMAFEQPT